MTLRDRLESSIGHDVGWDVVDCPACGPVPHDEAGEHDHCSDRPSAPPQRRPRRDALDLDEYGTAASAQSDYNAAVRERIDRTNSPHVRTRR